MTESERYDAVTRRWLTPGRMLIGALTLAAAIWGGWWLIDRLAHVYVLDARIAADMVLISSRVPGWVVAVPVGESKRVHEGDVLLEIDARQARLDVAQLDKALGVLDAELAAIAARITLVERRTESRVDASEARLTAARSELMAASSEQELAASDWQRVRRLFERELVSRQGWEEARNRFRTAEQNVRHARAGVALANADLAEAQAERSEVNVLEAERTRLTRERKQRHVERQAAAEVLADHTVRAPIDGVIDELFIDAGEYVAPGQRVLMLHDPEDVWVKANVKETDIRYLAIGTPAEVRVDALPDEVFEARVSRIGAAATSQFALLPNPNPSGNFTKITQRLEVTLELTGEAPLLKPGMMVEVKIAKRD